MRLLSSLAALTAAICLAVVPVSAAVAAPADSPGVDVSWPQCGRTLPTSPGFAIVGVNGPNGVTGNTTNSCLADELAWAGTSVGGAVNPVTSLYAMTQDPGQEANWWPSSDQTRAGTPVRVPATYGDCAAAPGATTGPENSACAYVYGFSIAEADAARVPSPSGYFWWIDVEEGDISWLPDTNLNAADIEGVVAGFAAADAATGIYSTPTQWQDIAGTTAETSTLAGLPNWIAGIGDKASAEANCYSAPFTPQSAVTLAQYQVGDQDFDLSCNHLASTPTPSVTGTAAVDRTLTAHSGTWSPAPVTLRYQWTRDGKAITHATGSTYRTVAADAGHQVRVVVTGSESGFTSIARTGNAVRIAVPVSRLSARHTLATGATLLSPNGRYHLTQQTGGNLVLFKDTGKAIWMSHTSGKGDRTTMQSDGNLVISTPTHHAVWSTRTSGKRATYAVMQSDGNFVLYTAAGKAVWATHTNGK